MTKARVYGVFKHTTFDKNYVKVMIKSYVLAIYSILIFLFGWFVSPIEISMQAPAEIVAGVAFDVQVVISKGDVEGFARFQQKLPKGFSAELIDAETGTFSFEDQTVKFFWLIIPEKQDIVLRYRITTDPNISGKYSLDGIFSYIDGDKKYAEMPMHEIMITPSPLADASSDTTKIEMTALPQIVCERKSVKVNSKGEIEIEILVNRGDLSMEQFAKIQETIPKGYEAQSIETKGGIFTYQNDVVKFLWMTLPKEQEYTVAYKLIPKANTDLSNLAIGGNFSYLVNGQTVEIQVKNTEKSIAQIVEEQLAYQQGEGVDNASSEAIGNETTENTNTTDDNTSASVENETADVSEDINSQVETITTVKAGNTEVSYRVQIAAGHKSVKAVPYFSKLKVKEPISIEMLEGWYKYTIGGFSEYLQARNKRNNIWAQTPIKDAFVTAYNSGQRITVQEALMISNQTWYQ